MTAQHTRRSAATITTYGPAERLHGHCVTPRTHSRYCRQSGNKPARQCSVRAACEHSTGFCGRCRRGFTTGGDGSGGVERNPAPIVSTAGGVIAVRDRVLNSAGRTSKRSVLWRRVRSAERGCLAPGYRPVRAS